MRNTKINNMPKFDVKVTPIRDDEKRDRNWYQVDIKTYKENISGKFEHWEIRDLIGKLDNAIR